MTTGAGAGGAGGGEGGEEGVSGVGGGDPGSDGGVGGDDPGSDGGVGPIGAGEGGADLPSLSSPDILSSAVDPSPSLGETGVADKDGGPAGAAPGNIEGSDTLGDGVVAGEDGISGPGKGGAGSGVVDFLGKGSIRDVPLPEGAEGVGDPEDVEVGEGLSSEDFCLSAPAEDR